MPEPLRLATPREKDNKSVIEELRTLLAKAEAGKIASIVLVAEDDSGYEYTRVGCTYEAALGLHSRAIYKLNEEWSRG